MAIRLIKGNLAEDPTTSKAGNANVTKLVVLENTGRRIRGEWQEDATPTRHNVEVWFDFGDNVASSLHRGDRVIVEGDEYTESWGEGDDRQYRRVIRASAVGPDLRFQVAQVRKVEREDNGQ